MQYSTEVNTEVKLNIGSESSVMNENSFGLAVLIERDFTLVEKSLVGVKKVYLG